MALMVGENVQSNLTHPSPEPSKEGTREQTHIDEDNNIPSGRRLK